MADKQILYVYESPKLVVTSWVIPDISMSGKFKWSKDVYSHPEVTIYVGKAATVGRRRMGAVNQAVLQALHAEGITLLPLEHLERTIVRKKKETVAKQKQERLF